MFAERGNPDLNFLFEGATVKQNRLGYARALFIDKELRTGTFPNTNTIAKKYEGVSPRTIARDIEYMKNSMNCPIEYDEHEKGYYYSQPNFSLPAFLIGEDELFSIAVMQKTMDQYRNTPLYAKLNTVFDKIAGFLPNKVSVDSYWLDARMSFIPEPLPEIDEHTFKLVFEALRDSYQLRFYYKGLGEHTHSLRTFDPYHAICKNGNWYVLGLCHKRNDIRLFAFSRMKEITQFEKSFIIPDGFDPFAFFDKCMGVWVSDAEPFVIQLLFIPEANTYVSERVWHENQKMTVHDDGSVLLEYRTTQIQETLRWVLGQGRKVKVLGPSELIEMVRKEIEAVALQYR